MDKVKIIKFFTDIPGFHTLSSANYKLQLGKFEAFGTNKADGVVLTYKNKQGIKYTAFVFNSKHYKEELHKIESKMLNDLF